MQKKFFSKNFLTPKTSKNVIFGPKNREKMAHLVSTPQRVKVHESMIPQNFSNKIIFNDAQKNFFRKKIFCIISRFLLQKC